MIAFLVTMLLVACEAHNWVNTLSRSPQANTVAPTLPSSTGQPHVQVIAGQGFQVEWMQGHGKDAYFILLAEADIDKLAEHKDLKELDKYLEATGATKTPPTGKWMRFHRTGSAVNEHAGKSNYFEKEIPRTSNLFVARDEVFDGNIRGVGGNKPENVHQWQYPSSVMSRDRRTFHSDLAHPWIIGMWRFGIPEHEPARPDVALFNVPAGTPPGKYHLHYRWQGYYDLIDIQVVPGTTDVANPYGLKPDPSNLPPPVFQRIPHCEFKNPVFTGRCMRIVSTEEACIRRCARQTPLACGGVNVVNMFNPNTVYNNFADEVNIPFDDADDAPLCSKRQLMGSANETQARLERFKVCYVVQPAPRTDISTEYYVTDDPDDPAFYSTCHVRVPPVLFDTPMPPPPPPPKVQWLYGKERCLPCNFAGRNGREDVTLQWPLRSWRCEDCDALAKLPVSGWKYLPMTSKTPPMTLTSDRKRCDGFNGNWAAMPPPCPKLANGNEQPCSTTIRHYGNSQELDVTLWDAYGLIRSGKYSFCSDTIISDRNQTSESQLRVQCLRKTPACCTPCMERTSNSDAIYALSA